MAIAYDTKTFGAAYTSTGTQTVSHAASASARAAIVLITQNGSTTNQISGVTYGGAAMTLLRTPTADNTEAGLVFIYWLDGIAPGTQNVAMTTTGTADKRMEIVTVTVAAGKAVRVVGTGNESLSASASNPALTISGLTPGTQYFAVEVIHSGLNAMTATPQTSPAWTLLDSQDIGTQGRGYARILNTPTGTTITAGWIAATADDYAIQGAAFYESDPPAQSLTAATITGTTTAGAAVLSVSAQNLTAATITGTTTAGAAVLSQSLPAQNLTAATITGTTTAGAAVLSVSAQNLTAATITGTTTAGAAVLSQSFPAQALTAAAITGTTTAGAAVLSVSGVTLTAATITGTATAGAAVLSVDAQNLTAAAITGTVTVSDPGLSQAGGVGPAQALTADTITGTVTVGVPVLAGGDAALNLAAASITGTVTVPTPVLSKWPVHAFLPVSERRGVGTLGREWLSAEPVAYRR